MRAFAVSGRNVRNAGGLSKRWRCRPLSTSEAEQNGSRRLGRRPKDFRHCIDHHPTGQVPGGPLREANGITQAKTLISDLAVMGRKEIRYLDFLLGQQERLW